VTASEDDSSPIIMVWDLHNARALVSAYHLYPHAKDVVKRWVNEAQEAVNAKSSSSFAFRLSLQPALVVESNVLTLCHELHQSFRRVV
jgi:hypothetical protein